MFLFNCMQFASIQIINQECFGETMPKYDCDYRVDQQLSANVIK